MDHTKYKEDPQGPQGPRGLPGNYSLFSSPLCNVGSITFHDSFSVKWNDAIGSIISLPGFGNYGGFYFQLFIVNPIELKRGVKIIFDDEINSTFIELFWDNIYNCYGIRFAGATLLAISGGGDTATINAFYDGYNLNVFNDNSYIYSQKIRFNSTRVIIKNEESCNIEFKNIQFYPLSQNYLSYCKSRYYFSYQSGAVTHILNPFIDYSPKIVIDVPPGSLYDVVDDHLVIESSGIYQIIYGIRLSETSKIFLSSNSNDIIPNTGMLATGGISNEKTCILRLSAGDNIYMIMSGNNKNNEIKSEEDCPSIWLNITLLS